MTTTKNTKTTYRVTVNGAEYTTTTTRVLTHALVCTDAKGRDTVLYSWHGSEENAQKARGKWLAGFKKSGVAPALAVIAL